MGRQGCLFPHLAGRGKGARLVWAYGGTGAAFVLWHLSTLLMGGQYPGRHWYVSVFVMVVGCVLVLPVFTWLRLRSGPVVSAIVGHTSTQHLEQQADRPDEGRQPAAAG
ncbi:type II CAAX prenyl endopeptidase Rce1 family protein [Streptomyces sp. NRRL F-5755]|uniref:CPBP family glutamic-type intramembrane protease n=1 Tax=Streptomyces sp. NRRL F-5755 TaxID=1519475 RepID=UPI001F1852B9|nr:CPBP family glutamic-type intramembrane protease [Streptomyces sp. NRRL F-5755]